MIIGIFGSVNDFTEMIETAHKHGLGVMAWTVDDVEEAKALIKIGADAICTNRPDILKTIF